MHEFQLSLLRLGEDAMTKRIAVLFVLLLATGISAALGDVSLYRWAKNGGWIWMVGSYVLWILSVTFFGVYL